MKTIAITGVLGYSGRYIAAEAVRRGYRVIGLTNSAGRLPNPQGYELRSMPWSTDENVLEGVDVLVNTYRVRFSYKGRGHAAFSHDVAVENTKHLFAAARAAGVKRVVHTSITHPHSHSGLPYFRGKAELEDALSATGIPHSILRPVLPVPAWFGLLAARVLGCMVGDVMLTRDEIAGLSQDLLAVDCPPAGCRSLHDWVASRAGTLGRAHAGELSRRM